MVKFLAGLLIGVILVPAAFYLYLRSGSAPVATWAPPMPMERFLVKTAMHATIGRQEKPVHLSSANNDSLVAGARVYLQDCAECHGLPGRQPTAEATGMYPRPPQFFRPHAEKIDDPPAEVYWKVKNGIRLTGMPGFRRSLNDSQIKELTAFLEDATSLPPAAVAVLKAAPQGMQKQVVPSKQHGAMKHKKA